MTRASAIEFSVTAGACIHGCLLLFLLPLDLVFALCAAIVIHECSHILALMCFRIPILQIEVGIGGAAIQTVPLAHEQEMLCAAAGPAGSFLCLILARQFPLLALCGCVQGLYNLLPVYPLDGGRILRCLCACWLPAYETQLCNAVRIFVIVAVFSVCLFLCFRIRDSLWLLPAVYFLLQTHLARKFPCKQPKF